MNKNELKNIAIVLVRPKYPENIGAAARSAANMGITQLVVVTPSPPDQERMRKMATHHASQLIDNIAYFADVAEALASFNWVVGTSARQGRQRHSQKGVRRVVAELLPRLENNSVALVFGSEDRGLTNEDLKFCNVVTSIPTADFSSLNLAQAVAVVCYELYSQFSQSKKEAKQPVAKLASSRELETMYALLEQTLSRMNFLKEADYPYWMHNFRHFLGRLGLRGREVKFVRRFCQQVVFLADKLEDVEKRAGSG